MGGLLKCLLYLVYLDTGFPGPVHAVACAGALCAVVHAYVVVIVSYAAIVI